MYEQQSLQLFGNAALITSSDMGWFLFLVDSRFLGGMIGVVDQGKGIHKNFRTRAVELSWRKQELI